MLPVEDGVDSIFCVGQGNIRGLVMYCHFIFAAATTKSSVLASLLVYYSFLRGDKRLLKHLSVILLIEKIDLWEKQFFFKKKSLVLY